MNKVHTLYRIVKTRLGSAYAHPMKTFDELKTAEDALTKAASGLAEVIEGTVLAVIVIAAGGFLIRKAFRFFEEQDKTALDERHRHQDEADE